jgi:hypothetical protein
MHVSFQRQGAKTQRKRKEILANPGVFALLR